MPALHSARNGGRRSAGYGLRGPFGQVRCTLGEARQLAVPNPPWPQRAALQGGPRIHGLSGLCGRVGAGSGRSRSSFGGPKALAGTKGRGNQGQEKGR
uniref:Uncharacterized protein n=1 Tax=uncultured marine virus TaxID=186617 RepID=A0A0F7L311_9VIRU|nr:hypothetical protein [uncultured marine virus]